MSLYIYIDRTLLKAERVLRKLLYCQKVQKSSKDSYSNRFKTMYIVAALQAYRS